MGLHLCKTGGKEMGQELRSGHGWEKMDGPGQRWQRGPKARVGARRGLGGQRAPKPDRLEATQGSGITARAGGPTARSRYGPAAPVLPSSPPDPQLTKRSRERG